MSNNRTLEATDNESWKHKPLNMRLCTLQCKLNVIKICFRNSEIVNKFPVQNHHIWPKYSEQGNFCKNLSPIWTFFSTNFSQNTHVWKTTFLFRFLPWKYKNWLRSSSKPPRLAMILSKRAFLHKYGTFMAPILSRIRTFLKIQLFIDPPR